LGEDRLQAPRGREVLSQLEERLNLAADEPFVETTHCPATTPSTSGQSARNGMTVARR
jgi:hypothetical protein